MRRHAFFHFSMEKINAVPLKSFLTPACSGHRKVAVVFDSPFSAARVAGRNRHRRICPTRR